MTQTTIGFDQTDEEILNYEISDDVLEGAGTTGNEKVVYTLPSAIICLPFVRPTFALFLKRK